MELNKKNVKDLIEDEIQTMKVLKKPVDKQVKTKKKEALSQLSNIIKQLPSPYSNFINEAYIHNRVPKEYLLSSILYTSTIAIGKTVYTCELGYKNYANSYYIILGSRGDGKSQAINLAVKPITVKENEMSLNYEHAKKNKANDDEEPIRKRFQSLDATPEALERDHFYNQRGIGCNYDEMHDIIGQISDRNSTSGQKYKVLYLKGFNNGIIDVSRKTSESYRIPKTYISLLGGLQKQFTKKLLSGGNLESGLVDRLLFVNLLKDNHQLSSSNMKRKTLNKYNECVNTVIEFSDKNVENEVLINYTQSARARLRHYTQSLLNERKKAEGHIKEYLAKLPIHVHKIAIQIHVLKSSVTSNFRADVELDTIELAIKINEFYKLNFQMMLNELDQPSINKEDVVRLGHKNGATHKEIASVVGHQVPYVSKKKSKLGLQ